MVASGKSTHCRIECRPRIWTLEQYYGKTEGSSLELIFNCSVVRLNEKRCWLDAMSSQNLIEMGHTLAALVPSYRRYLDPVVADLVEVLSSEVMHRVQSVSSKFIMSIGRVLPRASENKALETTVLIKAFLDLLRNNNLLCTNFATFKNTGVRGGMDIVEGLISVSPAGICFYRDSSPSRVDLQIAFWQLADVVHFDQRLSIEYYPSSDAKTTETIGLETYLAQQLMEDIASYLLASIRANRMLYYCHQGLTEFLFKQNLRRTQADAAEYQKLIEDFVNNRSDSKFADKFSMFEKKKQSDDKNWFHQLEYQRGLEDQEMECNSHNSFAFIIEHSPSKKADDAKPEHNENVSHVEEPGEAPSSAKYILEVSQTSPQQSLPATELKYHLTVLPDPDAPPELSSERSSRKPSKTNLLSFAEPSLKSRTSITARRSIRQDEIPAPQLMTMNKLMNDSDVKSALEVDQPKDEEKVVAKVEAARAEAGLDGKPNKEVMKSSILSALRKLPPKKNPI